MMRIVINQANLMNRNDGSTARTVRRSAGLWVATSDGARLARPINVAPIDAPELPLTVTFEGLTADEQRFALAAFPGGKRFRLDA